jgi:hypothetical protein
MGFDWKIGYVANVGIHWYVSAFLGNCLKTASEAKADKTGFPVRHH